MTSEVRASPYGSNIPEGASAGGAFRSLPSTAPSTTNLAPRPEYIQKLLEPEPAVLPHENVAVHNLVRSDAHPVSEVRVVENVLEKQIENNWRERAALL